MSGIDDIIEIEAKRSVHRLHRQLEIDYRRDKEEFLKRVFQYSRETCDFTDFDNSKAVAAALEIIIPTLRRRHKRYQVQSLDLPKAIVALQVETDTLPALDITRIGLTQTLTGMTR